MELFKSRKKSPSFRLAGLRRAKEKYFLALDLGTEAIKGLLFEKVNGKITILKSSLQYFQPFGVFDSRFFETGLVKKTLSKTIEEITFQMDRKVRPKYTVLGLPANILKSQIFFKRLKRKNPKEKIQEKEAKSIINSILAKTQKDISQEFTQKTGILAKDIYFLDLKILEIKIDGYKVSQLLNFSGQDVDFRLISTFLLKYDLEKVKKDIQDLGFKILKIVDSAESLLSALGDKSLSGIFLDIGGKVSKIIIIKDGEIQRVSEFDGGGDDFSQILSQTLGISRAETEDLKVRYSKKNLSEGVRKRIKEIVLPTTKRWFNNLKGKLEEVQTSIGVFPPVIFIFGGGSILPEVQEVLNEGDWGGLSFLGKPTADLLLPKDLKNIEDKTQSLTSPQNIPSLLLCYE